MRCDQLQPLDKRRLILLVMTAGGKAYCIEGYLKCGKGVAVGTVVDWTPLLRERYVMLCVFDEAHKSCIPFRLALFIFQ